jgi:3-hydroxyacyl-[acyl-carrier-protein] dehydratase
MPPQLLYDIAGIDIDRVLFDQEAIRQVNPQRGDMEHLNAIAYVDSDLHRIVGYKDVRHDEFWVPGHIPGRPLLPGVIMIEAAAQLAGFYTAKYRGWTGFVGFGGADGIRFRQAVTPGQRLHMIAQRDWERHGRMSCRVQGLVNGNLVFEAGIIGAQV